MIVQQQTPTEARDAGRRTFAMPGGCEGLVREPTPEDADGLRRMFARCSRETIYLRFYLPAPSVPEGTIGLLVGAAKRGGGTLVAVGGEEILGHAMYARDGEDDREAEAAVIVEDGRRSGGLGALLLWKIAKEARRNGVETLTCATLGDNYPLLRLARRVFSNARTSYAGGACWIRVPLSTTPAEAGAGEGAGG